MGTWSWQYADWRSQPTLAAQRDRLALHLQEIEERKDALSVSGAGMSASYSDLEQKLDRLGEKWDDLDTKVRGATSGYRHNLRLQRP